MKKIRLILIEDNRLLREGITDMLKKERDMNVVAAFDDTDIITERLSELKPHIALLDLGLRKQNSLKLAKALKNEYRSIKIIIMGLVPLQEEILKFVEAGVSGFILKDATLSQFLKTIRDVCEGKKVLPPLLANSLFSQIMEFGVKEFGAKKVIQSVRMTKREREIIALIAEGLANKEIAFKLNLSIYTVKSHVHNILEKMALNTRVQIAIHAKSVEDKGTDKTRPE